MCHQANIRYRPLHRECAMMDSAVGKVLNHKVDRIAEEHWNCIHDILGHWRSHTKGPDRSLMGRKWRYRVVLNHVQERQALISSW
ncbi:hypothetical protein RB195_011403 [Necator americanus]|uniref:Uncharacterized protein n=1 Tax=Necator americanus TaxID=51031 RepID=A0ABR1D290_NECAM